MANQITKNYFKHLTCGHIMIYSLIQVLIPEYKCSIAPSSGMLQIHQMSDSPSQMGHMGVIFHFGSVVRTLTLVTVVVRFKWYRSHGAETLVTQHARKQGSLHEWLWGKCHMAANSYWSWVAMGVHEASSKSFIHKNRRNMTLMLLCFQYIWVKLKHHCKKVALPYNWNMFSYRN